MTTNLTRARWNMVSATLISLAAAGALVACGGGDDGDSAAATPSPVAPASLTLSGTAAVGIPVAGQTVSVRCSSGGASAVTEPDGSYSVVVPSGAWPCVAQVTAASGTVLTTVASGSGTSAIANLTPATELIVALLVGTDPEAFFQTFDNALLAAITAESITAAQQRMVSIMAAAGVDFTAVGDLLASGFTASYDAALVALDTQLTASGTTLGTLSASIAAASSPSSVSVSASLLLQPSASSCGALRSATYRILTPTNGAPLSAQSSLISLNAATLAATHSDQSTGTWVPNGACRFTEQHGNYSADITVTQAGVLAARYTTDGVTFRNYLGFPEQTHAVGELAGTWNVLGMTRVSSATYVGSAGTLTYDSNGALTAATNCQNNATWAIDVCAAVSGTLLTGVVPLAADASGGFDLTNPNSLAVTGRLFVFEPGSGDLMMASVTDKGELFVSAAIKSVALPALGFVSSSWNLDNIESFVSASPVYVTSSTVSSVDSAAGSWTRARIAVGGTATHPETLFANSPRTGFTHRPSVTVSDSNGALVTVNEFTSMSVPGTGFSPLFLTTGTKLFELSTRLP